MAASRARAWLRCGSGRGSLTAVPGARADVDLRGRGLDGDAGAGRWGPRPGEGEGGHRQKRLGRGEALRIFASPGDGFLNWVPRLDHPLKDVFQV